MNIPYSHLVRIFFASLLFALGANPGLTATLNISSGIHTYTTLNNTTVTMTGRCELHLIATNNLLTSVNPMPGCIIHLDSPDSWLFLDNTRPSYVHSTYLAQVRVNGAVADTNSNIRVAQFDMGTMIIPLGPSFLPLQVFTGSQFGGASTNLAAYTFYCTEISGNACLF